MGDLMLPELWAKEVRPHIKDPWDVRALSLASKALQAALRPCITSTPGEDRAAFGSPDEFGAWARTYEYLNWTVAWLTSAIRGRNTALVDTVPTFFLADNALAIFASNPDMFSEEERALYAGDQEVALLDLFWLALKFPQEQLDYLRALWLDKPCTEDIREPPKFFDACLTNIAFVDKTYKLGYWQKRSYIFVRMLTAFVDIPFDTLDWAWENCEDRTLFEQSIKLHTCNAANQLKWRLLRLGVPISAGDLDEAFSRKNLPLVRWLVALGIELIPRFWTYAVAIYGPGDLEIARFLREHGCPFDKEIFELFTNKPRSALVVAFFADMLCAALAPDKRAIADALLKDPVNNRPKLLRLLDICKARYELALDHDMGLV